MDTRKILESCKLNGNGVSPVEALKSLDADDLLVLALTMSKAIDDALQSGNMIKAMALCCIADQLNIRLERLDTYFDKETGNYIKKDDENIN